MDTLAEHERKAYERALAKAKCNRTRAARMLGVPLATFRRRLEMWPELSERYPALRGNPNTLKALSKTESTEK